MFWGLSSTMSNIRTKTPTYFFHLPWRPLYPIFLLFESLYFILFFIFIFIFFKDFIYLFMRDTEREAETQAEGGAGSMQGARCGTRSWVSRIMPWPKAALNRWATGAALNRFILDEFQQYIEELNFTELIWKYLKDS